MASARNEFQRFATLSDGEKAQPTIFRDGEKTLCVLGVAVDDRDAVRAHQFGKEAKLGGKVVVESRVIIHVVAGDVGEGSRRDLDAVQTILIEAMARRLERQMLDAVTFHLREQTMKLDRIRGRVLERKFARRRDDANGADACRALTQRCPNLAQENRDRGLALGAGDGGHRLRLRAIEFGSRAGETESGIFVSDETHAECGDALSKLRPAEHGSCTAAHGIGDKLRAVDMRARQCREQIAGLDLAAVARESGKFLRRLHGALTHLHRPQHRPRLWCHYVFSPTTGSCRTPRIGAMRAITLAASGAAV